MPGAEREKEEILFERREIQRGLGCRCRETSWERWPLETRNAGAESLACVARRAYRPVPSTKNWVRRNRIQRETAAVRSRPTTAVDLELGSAFNPEQRELWTARPAGSGADWRGGPPSLKRGADLTRRSLSAIITPVAGTGRMKSLLSRREPYMDGVLRSNRPNSPAAAAAAAAATGSRLLSQFRPAFLRLPHYTLLTNDPLTVDSTPETPLHRTRIWRTFS